MIKSMFSARDKKYGTVREKHELVHGEKHFIKKQQKLQFLVAVAVGILPLLLLLPLV